MKEKDYSKKKKKFSQQDAKKKIANRQNMNDQRPDFYGEIGGA